LHDRFSPSPLIVFAGLAAPVSLTVFLLVSPVLMATAWVLDALEVEPTFGLLFPAATTIAVIIALIGLLNRNRLKRFRDELTYRTALLSAVGFLGVCAYVTPLLPMLSTYGHEEGLIAVALLLAAWEIKKELSESPTQALRFGLLFSIIFIVLTLAACCGLNLLPTSGW
jgi:hypothetical protein